MNLSKFEIYQVIQDALRSSMPTIIREVVDVNDRIQRLPDLATRAKIRRVIDISDHQFRKYEKLGVLTPINPPDQKTTLYRREEILELYIKEQSWMSAVPGGV